MFWANRCLAAAPTARLGLFRPSRPGRTLPNFLLICFGSVLGGGPESAAAAAWNRDTHQIGVGDFNQDGRDDLLLIARRPEGTSGIVLSTAAGIGRIHQAWPTDYLGIPWSEGRVAPVIGNFNASDSDRRDDIFLQRATAGLHYVTLTDPFYRVAGKDQTFGDRHLDLSWSGGQRRIHSADFDGDGRSDLYLQPRSRSIDSSIVYANPKGQFTDAPAPLSWANDLGGLRWSTGDAIVHPGDFNGDGRADLLVQAQPRMVPIYAIEDTEDGPWAIPLQVHDPDTFGIAWAARDTSGFSPQALQWSRDFLGLDWSPSRSVITIGDFDGDGRSDIFLQPRRRGDPAYLVRVGIDGTLVVSAVASPSEDLSWDWSSAAGSLVAGDFDGDGRTDLFRMPTDLEVESQLVTLQPGDAGLFSSVAVPVFAPPLESALTAADRSGEVGEGGGGFQTMSGGSFTPNPGSAVGAIDGTFSVDPSGAATYHIPIKVPPGVAGMTPSLALAYNSRSADGVLGVGWTLTGLSVVNRCPKTFAQDGLSVTDDVGDGVDLDDEDRYCLDGNRLMLVDGSTTEYRTEIESFQRIKSSGTAGNGPSKFVVEDAAGLKRTYGQFGAATDALVLADGTPHAIAYGIKRIEDSFGNFISFTYLQDTGTPSSHVPSGIIWGRQSNVVGEIVFEYTSREEPVAGFLAGASVGNDRRLERIITYSGASPVREYVLTYAFSPTTSRAVLAKVDECERTTDTCLASTTLDWQTGARGFTGHQLFSGAARSYQQLVDLDGNGVLDYAYPSEPGLLPPWGHWMVRRNSPNGTATSTGLTRSGDNFLTLDYNGDGHGDILQFVQGNGLQLLRGRATTPYLELGSFVVGISNLPAGIDDPLDENAVAADINGDGRDDIIWTHADKLYARISGAGGGDPEEIQLEAGPGSLPGYLGCSPRAENALQVQGVDGARLRVVQFDSDGRADILLRRHYRYECEDTQGLSFASDFAWYVYSYGSDGWFKAHKRKKFYAQDTANGQESAIEFLRVVDINGDGLSDLVTSRGGANAGWKLFASTGLEYEEMTWTGVSVEQQFELCTDAQATPFQSVTTSFDGNHCQGRELSTVELTLDRDQLADAQFVDYNHDGRTDVLVISDEYPNSTHPHWLALRSVGNGFSAVAHDTGTRASYPDTTFVADVNADGLPDLVSSHASSSAVNLYSQSMRGPAPDLLTSIQRGLLDDPLQIRYAVLTNGSVYLGHENDMDGTGDGAGGAPSAVDGYTHFGAPISVVKVYQVPDGAGALLETLYHYKGAKINRRGRGFAGFAEVRATNTNSGMQTINRYMQSFPWTGMTRVTRTHAALGTAPLQAVGTYQQYLEWLDECYATEFEFFFNLSQICASIMDPSSQQGAPANPPPLIAEAISSYDQQSGGAPNSWHPYVTQSVESRYQPAKFQETTYEYLNYDSYGNAREIRVSVRDGSGGNLHRTTTVSTFDNTVTSTLWCPSRLLTTSVTHLRTAYSDTVTELEDIRRSVFTYYPNCMLQTEDIEPDSDQRITTEYEYDAAGNRRKATTTASLESAARSTETIYEAATLRFAASSVNALDHSESYGWDARHGTRTSLTDINGLTTTWTYDGFGRATSETAPLTTLTKDISREWCGSGITCQGPGAVYKVIESLSSGQQTIIEFDGLEREILRSTTLPTGTNALVQRGYDPLGREFRVSAPYRSGDTICWMLRTFDLQGRVTQEWSPGPSDDPMSSNCGMVTGLPSFDQALPTGAGGRLKTVAHDVLEAGGHIKTVTEDAGRVVARISNVMGRLLEVREQPADIGLVKTTYDYDAQGNNTWLEDPDGNQTKVTYNQRGFKTSLVDQNLGTWTYVHNGYGELKEQTDARGIKVCQTYDPLGRRIQRIEGCNYATGHLDRLVTDWGYDTTNGIGQLAAVFGPYVTLASVQYGELIRFDSLARPQNHIRVIGNDVFWYTFEYDDQGRLEKLTYPSTAGDATGLVPGSNRHTVENVYNAQGALQTVREFGGSATYWQLTATNAMGMASSFVQNAGSNGVMTIRGFDPATGVMLSNASMNSGGMFLEDEYEWDNRGNFRERRDMALALNGANLTEKFEYDGLDRLKHIRVTAPSINGGTEKLYTNSYSLSGRLLGRGTSNGPDYSNYLYGTGNTSAPGDAGPHAVRQVTVGGATKLYTYDNNGNVLTGDSRTVTWNSQNMPTLISRGQESAAFTYGPDHQRYKQHLIESCVGCGCINPTTTTLYVGGLMERIAKNDNGGLLEYRHYIQANGQTIAVHTEWSNGSQRDEYLHHDHLGSVVRITGSNGTIVDRLSYDPWGKRRSAVASTAWLASAPGTYLLPTSLDHLTRGFTGHEHLDTLGLIHMNGRVYDPELGRFLSADPVVQFPASTQGLDRYSYVLNNPLSATDPTGHIVDMIIGIGAAIFGGAAIAAKEYVAAFLIAAVAGFATSGDLKGALLSVASMAVTFGIGQYVKEAVDVAYQVAAAAVLHGLAQGVLAAVQGDNFGAAFLAGSIASAFGPQSTNGSLSIGTRAIRVVQAALIGGTVSKIGGGKFGNGAITGAFVQAFNHDSTDYDTFEKRAGAYRGMQAKLNAAGIDTVWFGAAAELNDFFAANEGWLFTSGEFMNDLGMHLYQENVATFNDIMSGQISARGQALDNLLVQREQMHVQRFVSNHFGDSVPFSVQAPVNTAFRFGRSRMDTVMRNSINYVEMNNGQRFNFWDTWHRIELGQAMMSQYRHDR